MKIKRIAHLGLAVRDWDGQLAYFQEILGLTLLGIEEVPEQKVRVAMFQLGEAVIELLSPLDAQSPIAKFLEKHGEGFHHLAYEVEDLSPGLAALEQKGIMLIDRHPRKGAHGKQIAFLHPRSTFGVLTELCE